MLISLCLAWAALAPLHAAAHAPGSLQPERPAAPIIVIWPPEGGTIAPSDGEFILGSVSAPTAPFTINGQTVPVYHNGAFLAWLPVTPGTFTFNCSLGLPGAPTVLARNITVTPPAAALPAQPATLDADSIWPRTETELRPGDWLAFHLRASSGQKARCRLGKRPWLDLREYGNGVYEAMQAVAPGEEERPSPVECRVGGGWSGVSGFSRAKASITSAPPGVAVVRSNAVLRSGPGNGYMAFPPPGTRLAVSGRSGNELRVLLSPTWEGWIDAKDVELLPPGAALPRAVASAINTSALANGTAVKIGLSDKIAFALEPRPESGLLTLRLFDCISHINWIVYDSNDRFVREVRWRQEAGSVLAIDILLAPGAALWGWQAAYEGGALKLELRKPPVLAAAPASPLKGRTIIVDPGHSPSTAASDALGPLGTREMDVNFAIAKVVERLLIQRGATPVLTRPDDETEISLAERARFAAEKGGDLFLSIHNNALPDGSNPFARPRGYSVFYYHPHSLALARHIYHAYEQHVSLFAGEDVRYGNLAMTRISAMPAALVESLYMMFPAHEEKLNDPAFRRTLAEAIVSGLESFLAEERAQQAKTASAPAPAPPAAAKPKARTAEPAAKRPAKPGKKKSRENKS